MWPGTIPFTFIADVEIRDADPILGMWGYGFILQ